MSKKPRQPVRDERMREAMRAGMAELNALYRRVEEGTATEQEKTQYEARMARARAIPTDRLTSYHP